MLASMSPEDARIRLLRLQANLSAGMKEHGATLFQLREAQQQLADMRIQLDEMASELAEAQKVHNQDTTAIA